MMTALDSLLETYRTQTATQRDKGTAFEKLTAAWFVTDPVQSKRFAKAELWSDWAHRRGVSRTDVGIDLVCTRHDGGLADVQCKLFDPDRRIMKADIDSFISASSNRYAIETVGDPRYPLDLLLRVTTVSLETMKIVRALPEVSVASRSSG